MRMLLIMLVFAFNLSFADTLQVKVPKIVCESCANKITKALKDVPNVENVEVDVKNKIVKVSSSKTLSKEAVKAAIENIKFEVESFL